MTLGLIVVGDYALATGADRHVAYASAQVAATANTLAWAWMIPADRVQLAAALLEAWQRPHVVACFGGLGTGVDDHTHAVIEALQRGRDEVGAKRHSVTHIENGLQVGNLAFFGGDPARSHAPFARWWRLSSSRESGAGETQATELVRWQLPEPASSVAARQAVKAKYPLISQRIIAAAGAGGGVALRLSGASKGRVQAARKALQAALGAS